MNLLYFFESIRNPVFDILMSIITILGEETVFLAVAVAVYWCIDKYQGYYLMSMGFIGTVVNQFLKISFRIARPWVIDPEFTIVESARAAATGYSFPSGHTQCAVTTFGGIALRNKNTPLRILCLIAVFGVPLSRMYLGVHTPLDVGVSFIIALVLIFTLHPILKHLEKTPQKIIWILGFMLALAIAFVVFMELTVFPADVDATNLADAHKNAYTLTGCIMGLFLSWFFDYYLIKFKTEAHPFVQVVKVTLGLALIIGIKSVLKDPLLVIFSNHDIAHLIRYLIVVLTAGVFWPLSFNKLEKLEKITGKLKKTTNRI